LTVLGDDVELSSVGLKVLGDADGERAGLADADFDGCRVGLTVFGDDVELSSIGVKVLGDADGDEHVGLAVTTHAKTISKSRLLFT